MGKRLQLRLLSNALTGEWRNGEAGRDGGPSPVNPGDSATRQEVRHEGLPIRSRWGGYHLARPGGPSGAVRRLVPAKSDLKPQTSNSE